MPTHSVSSPPDVLVVGTGLIGLACATAAAERGFNVRLIGDALRGESSGAAAGLLAPSIEREEGHTADFAIAARDRYPAYVEWLRERTGIDVPLNREGIIQLAVNEAGVRGLRRSMPDTAQWLDARALAELEPALAHGLGGVLHPTDGAVDNVVLLAALRAAAENNPRIHIVRDTVVELSFRNLAEALCRTGERHSAERVVLAAGAWSATISGLPRSLPVEPVRGQMIAYTGSPLRHAVYGPTGYVVPRANGRTIVGATMEREGFESFTTPEGVARLQRTATQVLPDLADVEPSEAWAGLRPISPDLQPILGIDPDESRLFYATGHSRNGILMTPITGDCIASELIGESSPADISAFSIARFSTPKSGA